MYQISMIDDIIEALGDPETGKVFRELIEKSNFLETEFNFPGAKKSVTGQEILQHIKGIEVKEGIGSIAAYEPASKKIYFDSTVIKQAKTLLEQSGVSPEVAAKYLQEQFSFTTIHELGHAGADLVGIDSAEKRAEGQNLGKQMPESTAKHIAQQERVADSFAEEVFKSAGKDSSKYSYLTAMEAVTSQQEAALGRELTVDETLQIEDSLKQSNIDPKSRIQLASYLEGDIQSEKLKIMSDSYSYGERVKIKSTEETFDIWGNPVPKEYPRPEVTPSKDIWDDIPDSKDLPPKNPVVQRIEGLTVGKPVPQSKPVIPASQTTPPPPKVVTERVVKTGNATAESSAKGRVFVAGKQSASTTSTTQAKITNQVIDDMVSKPSTGAPLKGTGKLRSMADDASQAVAAGAKNSGNLKMLGLAAAVGLGAAAYGGMRRTQQDNIDRRLEMQRRGIVS